MYNMIHPNCNHVCSGNCRRVGCNCQCGEWHGEDKEVEKMRNLFGEIIGEASMCWSETPSGVFESTQASRLIDELLKITTTYANARVREESAHLVERISSLKRIADEVPDGLTDIWQKAHNKALDQAIDIVKDNK